MRSYRQANPEYARRDAMQHTARSRALEDLARRHPDEYKALYAEHAAGLGEPLTDRTCACGAVITRKSGRGRWPSACAGCRGDS